MPFSLRSDEIGARQGNSPWTDNVGPDTPWALFYRDDGAERIYACLRRADMRLPWRSASVKIGRDVDVRPL